MNDEKPVFWAENYKILFTSENLPDFFPTKRMTVIEKLNAIFRLSIYLSVLLYLLTKNYLYLYIGILTGAFTYFIYYNQRENVELYFNSFPQDTNENLIQKELFQGGEENTNRIEASVNNPFSNPDLIAGDKTLEAPLPSWNSEERKEKIESDFNYGLYRDVSDIYGRENSQRQYYTVPSAQIPNNQTSFAKFLYGTEKTCKESTEYCVTNTFNGIPTIDTSNPYTMTDVKY